MSNRNTQRIILYRADTAGNAQNCVYRHEVQAETPEQLREALRYDHVFAKFTSNRRSNGNFQYADLLVLDCDNDHSDLRADWIWPEDLEGFLPGVSFVTYSSRNNNLPKGSRSARPRFHVIFPIARIENAEEYAALKRKAAERLPFFDRNALDPGRFFFGVKEPEVIFHPGERSLTDWLQEEERTAGLSEATIPEGCRNQALHRFALKTLIRFGETEEAYRRFREEAGKCSPPLAEEELDGIWRSACKYTRVIRTQPDYIQPEKYGAAEVPKWEEPIPLDPPELMPFPVEALPKTVGEYVSAVAESLQIPPDMAALCALGALSVCLQKKFAVRLNSDWLEPVNLYLLVIADPSERKSPCIKQMIAPIQEHEFNWNTENSVMIESSKKYKNALIRRADNLEKKLSEGKATREELQTAIEEEQNYIPMERLRLFLDDVTPEKLTSQMAANGGVCSIMSAEGGIFETFAGRYSGSANFDVALKAYSADPIRVDRASRPSETIRNPALTILLMMQPEMLSEIMSNKAFRGKGLTARFLYGIPTSRVGKRSIDVKTVPPEIRKNYEDLLFRLLQIEQGQTEEVFLSPDAKKIFQDFAGRIEADLPEKLADLKDWAGKIVGTTARIAALLCLAEVGPADRVCGPGEFPHYEITMEQMARAMAIAMYFIEHARAAYGRRGDENLMNSCRRALAAILRKGLTQINVRALMRLCRFLSGADEAQAVINHLESYGYLQIEDEEERRRLGHRGNTTYYVNPLAQKK